MKKDASVTSIFGMRGSGKSTEAINQVKHKNHPTIVVDPLGNWPKDLGVEATRTLSGVASKLKQYWRTNFRIVYVPAGDRYEALHQISEMLVNLQSDYKAEKHFRQIHLVIDEANLLFPAVGLRMDQQGFAFALMQGRHWGINITAITQRPKKVHVDLISQSENIYCLALRDDSSIKVVLDVSGNKYRHVLENLEKFEYLKISEAGVTTGKVRKPR